MSWLGIKVVLCPNWPFQLGKLIQQSERWSGVSSPTLRGQAYRMRARPTQEQQWKCTSMSDRQCSDTFEELSDSAAHCTRSLPNKTVFTDLPSAFAKQFGRSFKADQLGYQIRYEWKATWYKCNAGLWKLRVPAWMFQKIKLLSVTWLFSMDC